MGSVTGPNGQTTSFSYDVMGRTTKISYPDGGWTQAYYVDTAPLSIQTTKTQAPNPDVVTNVVMDGFSRTSQTQLQMPSYYGTGTIYTDTTYDALGRVASISNPYQNTYRGGNSQGGTTQYFYDALGRKTIQNNPDNSTLQWCYDGNVDPQHPQSNCHANGTNFTSGEWIDAMDEAGNNWQRASDAMGRLQSILEPSAIKTDYSYDGVGNLLAVNQHGTASEGARLRGFTYDSLSRLLTSSNPETGTICYGWWDKGSCQHGYDANGNLLYKTDANDNTVTYNHDALNRLTHKFSDDFTVADDYYYDTIPSGNLWGTPFACANGVGRLCLADHGGVGGTGFDYDPMGRVKDTLYAITTAQQQYVPGVAVNYDLAGNATDITYPDLRKVHQVYDGAGRLSSVTDTSAGGSGTTYFNATSYSPAGALTAATLGNGVTESLAYNSRLQPCHTSASSPLLPSRTGAGNLFDRQVFYGVTAEANCGNAAANNGNIWHIYDTPDGSQSQNFSYDALNRLTSAYTTNRPAATVYNHTYNYDSFGNMLPQDNLHNNPDLRIDPATNRLYRYASNAPVYSYDNAGNLTYTGTSDIGGHIFNYNALGDVYAMDNESTAKYYFNGSDERELKVTPSGWTSYVYLNGQPMAERTSDNTWTDYIYANGQKVAKVSSAAPNSSVQVTVRFTNDSYSAGTGTPVGGGDRNLFVTGLTVNGTAADLSQARYTSLTAAGCNNNGTIACTGDMIVTAAPGSTVAVTAFGSPDYYINPHMQILVNGNVALEADVPQTPQTYTIAASATQTQPATTYYLADQVGTTQMELDSAGYPIWQGQFTPFGQELDSGQTGMHYKFTGKERDSESGLDYFGARYYASSMGRWMSPDWADKPEAVPYSSLDNPQSLNLYGYVLNNPLSKADPDGHETPWGTAESSLRTANIVAGAAKGAWNFVAGAWNTVANLTNAQGAAQGVNFGLPTLPTASYDNTTQAISGAVTTLGVMAAGGPESSARSSAADDAALSGRAADIQGTLSPRTQNSVTTAVGQATNADGTTTRLVGSSEGTLRPSQRAALQPGEVAVKGQRGTHAEVNVLNHAQKNGQTLTTVAPSRPACSSCAATMKQNNVRVVNPQ